MKSSYKGSKYGTALILNDNHPGKATNVECIVGDGTLSASKSAAFDSQVSIRIHSYRHRLADCDGVSGKAAIDSLVMCGIIANDTTKEVKEVTYSQTKVQSKSDEKTVITIERV